MKTIARTLCFLCIFLAGSLAGSAQQSFHSQDLEPAQDLTYAIRIAAEEPVLTSDQNFIENSFRVEDWMTDTRQWKDAVAGADAYDSAPAEKALHLEDWMLEPFANQEIRLQELIRVEVEPPLKLEKWMYCCEDWNLVIR